MVSGKEPACQGPWLGRSPGQKMTTCSSFLAWKSRGQKSLAGHSPWGRKRVGHDLVTKQQQAYVPSRTFCNDGKLLLSSLSNMVATSGMWLMQLRNSVLNFM